MYDENLEKSFIGNVMVSRDAALTLADIESVMKPEDIGGDDAKKTFSIIKKLVESNKQVNPATLVQGGADINFIAEVSSLGISSNQAISEAKLIHSLASKRNLYNAAQSVMQQLVNGEDTASVKTKLSEYINSETEFTKDSTKQISELVVPTIESILTTRDSGGIIGTSTGFKSIDRALGGLLKGSLTIIGARPAMGKTAFALNMAEGAAAKTGLPVLVISLEMNNEMLVKRMFAKTSMIDAGKLRDGSLSPEDLNVLNSAADKLAKMPLWFDDTPIQSFSDIRARALKLKRQRGKIGLVLIDYLGLIETGNERNSNRVNEVSKISRGLKVLSKEIDAPIVALAQLNRGVEQRTDKRPMLSDLRDSGSIEQDADNVMFLYRDDYYNAPEDQNDDDISQVEFIVAKNRNGKRGTIKLAFDKRHNLMSEWIY
ncbi:replicative DNA helicase [Leuconostoc holzapfelii]|uniref:Replicative DNA helicase n=1 Tax=Leuconostoc holzapfelii TaxID=434464 RepID=A0A846ZEN7_9LACO|nr:replicative DNA helicase [Leuconostoc holzapfelii]NKZ18554.1 replicative DNA helicase [Leuconostoc holzapfelii]